MRYSDVSVWVQPSITFLDFSLVKMHVLGISFLFFFVYFSGQVYNIHSMPMNMIMNAFLPT